MIVKFKDYTLGYRTAAVALDNESLAKILSEGLCALSLVDGEAVLLPDDVRLECEGAASAACAAAGPADAAAGLQKLGNYDVCTIWEDGSLHCVYEDRSSDNFFFITGACNSNCVMCPSPEAMRRNVPGTNVQDLIDIARHIPSDTPHLTVTGGEPFLVGEEIFPFLRVLKEHFVGTEFLFLTNGRVFALEKYADLFAENRPCNSVVAVPVHGSCAEVHDAITQVPGSFEQTRRGIKRLIKSGVRVELRLVVSKLNMDDFDALANLVLTEFGEAEYVSVIAMEMTGNARRNKDLVWVPYSQAFSAISGALRTLIEGGMDVKLYNFPLCTVESPFWTLCEKSISPTKTKFADTCGDCRHKTSCGGVFAGTFNLEKEELRAIR